MIIESLLSKRDYKYWLIVITLILSLFVFLNRFIAEQRNNNVELVFDYEDVLKLSAYTGESMERIYRSLQKAGVTTICVPEDTLKGLTAQGKATLLSGEAILNMLRIGQIQLRAISAVRIVPGNYYVVIDQNSLYERAKNSLVNELGDQRVKEVERYVLEVKGYTENLENIGLGIDEDLVNSMSWYNFSVIPKIANSKRLDEVSMGLKVDKLAGIKNPVTTMLFSQNEVLGYGNNMNIVIEKMKKNNFNFGFIEFANQQGSQQLAIALPGQAIGVHSLPIDKMQKFNKEKAVERYLLAAAERGMRILYIHPFLDDKLSNDLLMYNEEYITQLRTRLEHRGFKITPVKRIPLVEHILISALLILVMSAGIAVIFTAFLKIYIPGLPPNFYNIFIGLFIMLGLVFLKLGQFYHWRALLALLTAIIFPPLALISELPREDTWQEKQITHQDIIRVILRISGITFAGALIITGVLSDPYHMLKIYQFTGVKLAFALPLLLVAFYYFLYPQRVKAIRFMIKRFLQSQISFGHVIGGFTVLLFFAVYIIRSGNYNVPVLNYESGLRQILGNIMLVRPRTKEFLIGYPMLFFILTYLGTVVSYKNRWLFYTLATVAPISMINTFCHFHAPLWLSVMRSINGLALGLLVGYVLVGLYKFGERVWKIIL